MLIIKTLVLFVLQALHANKQSNFLHTLEMKTHKSNTVAESIVTQALLQGWIMF